MTNTDATANETDAPQFSIGKIYLKDASVEAPNSPAAFANRNEWNPKVSIQHTVATDKLSDMSDDTYEVTLGMTITVAEEQRTLFLIEIEMGSIFVIRNVSNPEQLNNFLTIRCPKIIFPYARETIDNLIVKAGFPPLMLSPLNFSATPAKQNHG